MARATAVLMALTASVARAATDDQHHMCRNWANAGECTNNPGYMLEYCPKSCDEVMATGPAPSSFFDVVMPDINGHPVDFNRFRNKVTLVTNVASE